MGSARLLTAVAVGIAIAAATLVPPSEGIASRNGLDGPGLQGPVGTSQAYSSGVLDLRARGTLPDTPVAEVPADSPVLWRGAVLSDYDGVTWRAAEAMPGPSRPGAAPAAVRPTRSGSGRASPESSWRPAARSGRASRGTS